MVQGKQVSNADPSSYINSPLKSSRTSSQVVTQVGIGLMIYLVFGVAIYAWTTFSVVDALYFCVITMYTIGYGDIVPQTTFAKLFSCLFVLIGFGFIGALVSGMVIYDLDKQKHLLLSAVEGSHFRTAKKNAKHGNRMRIRMKVGMALVMLVLWILISTSVMMKFEPVFFTYSDIILYERAIKNIAKSCYEKYMI